MERWDKRVAVVTGASSGIGEDIAAALVKHGMTVVGLARREDRLKQLAERLGNEQGKFYVRQTDMRIEKEILSSFEWIEKELGAVSVLVNNAGIATKKPLAEESTANWKDMLGVNVLALSICTRETLKSMKTHGINDGHIINISSKASHHSTPVPGLSVYSATKKAVMAISEGLRRELALSNSLIRVTTICPGLVASEMMDIYEFGSKIPMKVDCLKPADVTKAVIFCLEMPGYCQINDITLGSTGEDEFKIMMSAAKILNESPQ
ncbi:dehydrogenase/reductase SDR family member 11 [Nilaparvata lugens]|uniref:dehydrogenase/reductase SDR family member 11 n=1 Tax=Nilaparvata lugens TaxID=108931 RepID=UPI00193DE809|nr:dehydrogenase/reductase SDR family member 11 [Nilaparvata lugens]